VPKIKERLHLFFTHLKDFISRPWYGPLLGFLALLDNFIIVVPTDGLLISSSLLRPKKWMLFAVFIAIGSTLGAAGLAYLVQTLGMPWLENHFPTVQQSTTWQITETFFDKYGLIVVFVIAISPLFQQPSVILASIAGSPLWTIVFFVFVGRLLKFLFMGYIASHAPRLLSRLWGIQGDLAEAGVDSKDLNPKRQVGN
jgi:membrane protein YqaA with SNARE-associated domain